MKNSLQKQSKNIDLSFKEYGEKSRHISKKMKTNMQQKANDAIDKALRQKSLRSILGMDDY